LQGPKIRVGDLPKDGVDLKPGAIAVFSTDPKAALPKIPMSYGHLHKDVHKGDRILLDDGLLEVEVKNIKGRDIACEVIIGGKLTSHKGFNVPTASLSVSAITEKDKEDLKFGIAQDVDWVALSFVRHAKEIDDLRKLISRYEKDLKKKTANPIRIIAKIEKHEALKNIDSIIKAVDGIMVARGDLGIETPAEEVPMAQKMLIKKCLAAAKPVIVATQMLDSMIRNPRPTRAEVSDVANAVIDHADAVMLSGESA
ncbi:MAG: pyruvate kinase, partial [Patescibacteria group bacterium]